MSAVDRSKSVPAASTEETREPAEIREDIDQTREELGDTVAAMAEKTDVKQQARAKAEELKAQASARAKELSDRAKEAAPDSPGEGMERAQRLAQEKPAVAIGAAFLAGMVFGRLLSR
jgi:ElaB/YqjD/DUF883 family membrane-anchored ribosome-binding protein